MMIHILASVAVALEPLPEWTLVSPSAGTGDACGRAVAVADFDGDRYAEVAMGCPGAQILRVYGGSPLGLDLTPADMSLSWGQAADVLATGDLDGDGLADLVLGSTAPGAARVEILYGSATGLHSPAGRTTLLAGSGTFGASLATGDLDGDGLDDLVVGQPGDSEVHVYRSVAGLGPDPATVQLLAGSPVGSEEFGEAVAVADHDGDGFADVLVGSPQASPANTGRVDRFLGGPLGVSTTADAWWTGGATNTGFGSSIAVLGDTDADGTDDIAVGAPEDDHGTSGLSRNYGEVWWITAAAQTRLVSGHIAAAEGDGWGKHVGPIGDQDGDGVADLLLATDAPPGTSWWLGSATGYAGPAQLVDPGAAYTDNMGHSSASGDIDLDGVPDVVVGVPGANTNDGRALVYTTPTARLDWLFPGLSGVANDVVVEGGPPGGTIALMGAVTPGARTVPVGPCTGEQTGLGTLRYLGSHPLDAAGGTVVTLTPPAALSGRTVWLQAVQLDGAGACAGLSNLSVTPLL